MEIISDVNPDCDVLQATQQASLSLVAALISVDSSGCDTRNNKKKGLSTGVIAGIVVRIRERKRERYYLSIC